MSDCYTSKNRYACPLIETCCIFICCFVIRFAAQDPSLVGKGAKAVFRDKEGTAYAVCTAVLVILLSVYPYHRTIFLHSHSW